MAITAAHGPRMIQIIAAPVVADAASWNRNIEHHYNKRERCCQGQQGNLPGLQLRILLTQLTEKLCYHAIFIKYWQIS
jgi:hypothetical protein